MAESIESKLKGFETGLKGVYLFKPYLFRDFRGAYSETFNERDYSREIKKVTGKEVKFVQDSLSRSFKNVLRGIHGDDKTWKLISCPMGRMYTVIVNCDKKDKDYGKWQSFDLSQETMSQVLVPPKFGTSHIVLSDWAVFQYKQSTYYDPKNLKQFTYRYDHPEFNIWWPIKKPILSKRDEQANTDLAGK
ncbi:dTDP-4-dehydrorhamnose 3,5-epimerase family protein [Nanoarchaeota archaeon]